VYDNGLVDRLHVTRLIIARSISLVFPVWHMLLNQSIPLPISGLHRDSVSCSCKTVDTPLELSSFLHLRRRLWIKGSILPLLNFAVLATCYLILTLCGLINTKGKKKNWWTSSPRRWGILSEWYQCDSFSRVNEGPNSQSTLQEV